MRMNEFHFRRQDRHPRRESDFVRVHQQSAAEEFHRYAALVEVAQQPLRSFTRNSVGNTSGTKPANARRANRRAPNARTIQTTPREFVEKYAEKLKGDPEGVIRELGLSPVSAGSSDGYRLGNLANSPYLSQTGLQPGDVILSVNGQAVGDIQRDRQQIEGLLQQGSARLEVQRGTRRFFVSASLR